MGASDDEDNEWMQGEAQLYIHAESTALLMLLTPTSKVRERAWLAKRGWRSVAGENVG